MPARGRLRFRRPLRDHNGLARRNPRTEHAAAPTASARSPASKAAATEQAHHPPVASTHAISIARSPVVVIRRRRTLGYEFDTI